MKRKLPIGLLSIALLVSVGLNVVVGRANLKYFEKSYEDLARQQVKLIEIRTLLESSDVAEAKRLIDKEIKWKGEVLAICLIEKCSERVEEILRSEKESKRDSRNQ